MTTNDEQHVPSEALLRIAWSDYCQSMDACNAWVRPDDVDPRAEFDRFLARVRRDAAREALDGLAEHEAELHSRDPEAYAECNHVVTSARSWRDTHYPTTEETP